MISTQTIPKRRSIRSFSPDPVREDALRGILEDARWAPSWRNTQAWHVWVVTGEALERFKDEFTRKLIEDAPSRPDLDMPGRDIPDLCARRTERMMAVREQTEAAAGLDCSREGKLGRMGELFGAPCLLVIGVDQSIAQAYAGFDCGAFAQTLCLAAEERGLGTCIMATAVRFPEILHTMLPVAPGLLMVVGVAIGYPDGDAPLNSFERERADLDEFVSWVK
jgi:nitroreductase